MPGRIRPSWQLDACPHWCAGEHSEHDHPDDRVHRSAGRTVAVIARSLHPTKEAMVSSSEATEFEIGLSRRDGKTTTWVFIGDGAAHRIELSLESARRVGDELREVLGPAGGDAEPAP